MSISILNVGNNLHQFCPFTTTILDWFSFFSIATTRFTSPMCMSSLVASVTNIFYVVEILPAHFDHLCDDQHQKSSQSICLLSSVASFGVSLHVWFVAEWLLAFGAYHFLVHTNKEYWTPFVHQCLLWGKFNSSLNFLLYYQMCLWDVGGHECFRSMLKGLYFLC